MLQIATAVLASLLFAAFASLSTADTFTGTLSGTCGYHQGSPSNVVFSETFTQTSGSTSNFCGFMPGSFMYQTLDLQLGERDNYLFAFGHHYREVRGPSGYGAFISFDATYQITEASQITSAVPLSTANTTVHYRTIGFGQDELSGCTTTGSIDIPGSYTLPFGYDPSWPVLPVGVGQSFTAVETIHMACNEYSGHYSSGWDDNSY